MAEGIEFSASRINTYKNCFGQYKFKYVDKIKPTEQTTYPNTVNGSVMHNILEDIFTNHRDKTEKELKKYLNGKFAEFYHKERAEIKKRGINFFETRGFEEPDFIKAGEKKLKVFALFAYRYFNSFKDVYPELKLEAKWDYLPDVSIMGFVDLIVGDDDHYRIVDFKTTSDRNKWLFVNYPDDIQSKFYIYMADKHFGKMAESFEYLIYAHMDKMVFFSQKNEVDAMTNKEKETFYEPITNIMKEIIERTEKPKLDYYTPSQKQCFWCSYKDRCEVSVA